ncbi:MAG TPA: DUF1684 domain-containing protein [Thermoanaerobaculia bacterium]|nr:DUF1684 domain-containing protein [Thermoanaerobaculia bacterium]
MRPSSRLAAAVVLAAFASGCRDRALETRPELDLEGWQTWREQRIESLAADDGWLTLIGLYWLSEGRPETFGTAPENDIVLPARPSLEGAPGTLGALLWDGERVTLEEAADSALEVDGEPVGSAAIELRTDSAPEPSELSIGTVTLALLDRAGELAVRAWDSASERRTLVDEIPVFEPSAESVLDARFEPAEPGSTIAIANVVGQVTDEANPGALVFELGGRELRLEALATATEGRYFLLVGDETNGVETYGGGRYLYVERRADGGIDLDLNRLYNPPCVFTEFATCPLPPRQNRLPLRIEAGEKLWEGDLH